jgi:hypothetical protein
MELCPVSSIQLSNYTNFIFIYLKINVSNSKASSSKAQDPSSQLCEDTESEAEDDDFDEPEPVNLKQKSAQDVTIRHELKDYCKTLTELQSHHIEEDSQRARHYFEMLKFSVVNSEIFFGANRQNLFNISIPQVALKLLSTVFEEHPNEELRSVVGTLQSLKNKGRIYTSDSNIVVASLRWLFWYHQKNLYYIDVLTASSAIMAVISCTGTPSRGIGSNPSENHVKIELWSGIFSAAFKLHKLKFLPVWELQHLFPGNAGLGSARSDFASIIVNNNGLQFAFFIVEFEQAGFETHKDEVVIIAELTHEFNRILAHMYYPSEVEINGTRLHFGLVNDLRVRFGRLQPIYDQKKSSLIYSCEDEILSFNFQDNNVETKVENTLRLITYLRETVCADGMRIRSLLNRQPMQYNYNLKAALPVLPNKAVQSRKFKTKFTPISKRINIIQYVKVSYQVILCY